MIPIQRLKASALYASEAFSARFLQTTISSSFWVVILALWNSVQKIGDRPRFSDSTKRWSGPISPQQFVFRPKPARRFKTTKGTDLFEFNDKISWINKSVPLTRTLYPTGGRKKSAPLVHSESTGNYLENRKEDKTSLIP
jgi:hypothetical protein